MASFASGWKNRTAWAMGRHPSLGSGEIPVGGARSCPKSGCFRHRMERHKDVRQYVTITERTELEGPIG